MSEILTENISKLLEKERGKEMILEKSLEKLKEQLSLCKGAIIAYEQLLNGSSSIEEELEKELDLSKVIVTSDVFSENKNKDDVRTSDLTNSGKSNKSRNES
jgi:predicted DNA-binding transcriptional regulator